MTRPTTRLAGACIVALTMLSACSIRPAKSPSDVPEEQRGAFGANVATGDVAAGSSQIFLLAPPNADNVRQLRSVPRNVNNTAPGVLRSLASGPNADEQTSMIGTALPADLKVLSVRTLGRVSTIDLGDRLDGLDPTELRQAIAQIVTTATAISGIDAVVITVNGEQAVWPRGDGQLTDQPLTAYDYPGFVESTQPAYPSFTNSG